MADGFYLRVPPGGPNALVCKISKTATFGPALQSTQFDQVEADDWIHWADSRSVQLDYEAPRGAPFGR